MSDLPPSGGSAASAGEGGEKKQQRSVSIGGARPRTSPAQGKERGSLEAPALPAAGVMLRQSSWGSREHALNLPTAASDRGAAAVAGTGGGAVAKNRSLWEKRSGEGPQRTGFRSNKDFWQQRSRQTPDLVLGLPVQSKAATAKTSAAVAAATTSTEQPPVPKPRTLPNTSSKSNSSSSSPSPTSPTRPTSLLDQPRRPLAPSSSTQVPSHAPTRPQVRVKPHVVNKNPLVSSKNTDQKEQKNREDAP